MKSKGNRAKLTLIYTLNNFIEFIRVLSDTEYIISEIGWCMMAVNKREGILQKYWSFCLKVFILHYFRKLGK